jgi:hypothetical protein
MAVQPRVDDAPTERFIRLGALAKRARQNARVQEVMSTSDFSFMADVIDRGTIVSYLDESVPINYPVLSKRRDTTSLARAGSGHGVDYRLNAARKVNQVDEGGEYLAVNPSDESFEAHTYKFGASWSLTWEAWLSDNRDLGMLMEYPQTFGLSARYTQQYVFTEKYANSATLFTAQRGNLKTGAGGALNAENLATGISTIRHFADPAGNVSVYTGPLYLVVPDSLEYTARPLVESTSVVTGNTTPVPVNNPVFRSVQVIVDPLLEAVSDANGTTAWYLFCDPRFRPALRHGFLRGYETPGVYVKEGDARQLMGGTVDPFDGDFLSDEIEFKLRFTFGVDEADWRGGYKSTGEAAAE